MLLFSAGCGMEMLMVGPSSTTSWRDLLRALTAAPSAVATIPAISPWSDVLAPLHRDYGDDPVIVVRTKGRHTLRRRRYYVVERVFPNPQQVNFDWHDYLSKAGITSQLALSFHLFDVPFSSSWNFKHIGLLLQVLLDRVHGVIGHPRPKDCHHGCREVRS